MDQFDRATQLEEAARAIALAKVLARTQGAGESLHHCIDCGVDIPEARRRAVPGCQRCVDCQAEVERSAVGRF